MADKKLSPWKLAEASLPVLGKRYERATCKRHGQVALNLTGRCPKCMNATGKKCAGPQRVLNLDWEAEEYEATQAGERNFNSCATNPLYV